MTGLGLLYNIFDSILDKDGSCFLCFRPPDARTTNNLTARMDFLHSSIPWPHLDVPTTTSPVNVATLDQ
jgi:hypothetical protein